MKSVTNSDHLHGLFCIYRKRSLIPFHVSDFDQKVYKRMCDMIYLNYYWYFRKWKNRKCAIIAYVMHTRDVPSWDTRTAIFAAIDVIIFKKTNHAWGLQRKLRKKRRFGQFMCNNCNCDAYEKCSIVGYMPIGFCCSNCYLYDEHHTCLETKTKRALKKNAKIPVEKIRPISTKIEGSLLKVVVERQGKKVPIYIDLQKQFQGK